MATSPVAHGKAGGTMPLPVPKAPSAPHQNVSGGKTTPMRSFATPKPALTAVGHTFVQHEMKTGPVPHVSMKPMGEPVKPIPKMGSPV